MTPEENALNLAKNQLEASRGEIEKLKESVRALTESNQTLRVANQELQEFIFTHRLREISQKAESAQDYAEDEDVDNCDGDCDSCKYAEHSVAEDTEVDIEIARLIRENLDLEGRLKGFEDALHILCAWLKFNPEEAQKCLQK